MKMAYPHERSTQAREYPTNTNGAVPTSIPVRNNGQSRNHVFEYKHNPYPKGEEPKAQKFPSPSLDKNNAIEPFYCGFAIEKTSPNPAGGKPSWTYQTYRRKYFQSSAFRADAIKRAKKIGNGVTQYDKMLPRYQKHTDRLLKDLNDAEPDKRLEWVIASVNPITGSKRALELKEVRVIVKRVGRLLEAQDTKNVQADGKIGHQGSSDGYPKVSLEEDQLRALDRERSQQAVLHEWKARQPAREAQAQGPFQAQFDTPIRSPYRQGQEPQCFNRDNGKPQALDSDNLMGAQFQPQGIYSSQPIHLGGNRPRPGPRPDLPSQVPQQHFHDQGGMMGPHEQHPLPPRQHLDPKQYHQANAQHEQGNARVPLATAQPRPDPRQFQGLAGQFGPPPPPLHPNQQQFNAHQSRPNDNPNITIIQDEVSGKPPQHEPKHNRPALIKTESFESFHVRHRPPKPKAVPLSPRTVIRMQREQERAERRANRNFVDYSTSEESYSDGGTVFTEAASDNDTIITPASGRSQYRERSYLRDRTGSSSSKGKKGKESTRRPTAHRRASSPPRPTRHHTVRRNSDRRASPSPDSNRRDCERLSPVAEQHIWNLEEQVREIKLQQDRFKEETIRKDEREKQERLAREREEKAESYGISGGRFDRAYDRQLRGSSNAYRRGFYD